MSQPTQKQEEKFAEILKLCQQAEQKMEKAGKTLEQIERKIN
jgi:hypothetical protein